MWKGENALLKHARQLLGPGYETWGRDLASPGISQMASISCEEALTARAEANPRTVY
jgi:hypothetical protein